MGSCITSQALAHVVGRHDHSYMQRQVECTVVFDYSVCHTSRNIEIKVTHWLPAAIRHITCMAGQTSRSALMQRSAEPSSAEQAVSIVAAPLNYRARTEGTPVVKKLKRIPAAIETQHWSAPPASGSWGGEGPAPLAAIGGSHLLARGRNAAASREERPTVRCTWDVILICPLSVRLVSGESRAV